MNRKKAVGQSAREGCQWQPSLLEQRNAQWEQRSARRFSMSLVGWLFMWVSCHGIAQGGPPGPMPVKTKIVETQTLAQTLLLPARAQAVKTVEIRPRIDGILLAKHFVEGQPVKKGDLLFEIEPDLLEATTRSSRAALAKANSDVAIALQTRDRLRRLLKKRLVSQEEVDVAEAEYRAAVAEEGISEAALQRSALDLKFAKIYAPISGVIGIASVSEGDLVKGDDEMTLVTINQLDPIWVNFSIPSSAFLAWQQQQSVNPYELELKLMLDKHRQYPLPGKLDYLGHQVDPVDGNVRVRAKFPNPNRALLPGLFLRIGVDLTFQ